MCVCWLVGWLFGLLGWLVCWYECMDAWIAGDVDDFAGADSAGGADIESGVNSG